MTVSNVIAVVNGKGGVLKTTTVSHLAVIAADSGWKVLAVDADAQGNLSRDLGFVPDGGAQLAAAVLGDGALHPVVDERRPNLAWVAGGEALTAATAELQRRLAAGNVGAFRAVEHALAPLAGDYNVILIDSGPGDIVLRRMILAAAHYVLIPSKTDLTSIPDGLADTYRTIAQVREDANPELEVLGVTLGPTRTNETERLRLARERAADVLGPDASILFDASIRDNGRIADHCRHLGIVATEYEVAAAQAAADAVPWYQLTKEQRADRRNEMAFSAATAAGGLAADWQQLADEVLARFAQRQAETAAA